MAVCHAIKIGLPFGRFCCRASVCWLSVQVGLPVKGQRLLSLNEGQSVSYMRKFNTIVFDSNALIYGGSIQMVGLFRKNI
jgi:hypothetical protein